MKKMYIHGVKRQTKNIPAIHICHRFELHFFPKIGQFFHTWSFQKWVAHILYLFFFVKSESI